MEKETGRVSDAHILTWWDYSFHHRLKVELNLPREQAKASKSPGTLFSFLCVFMTLPYKGGSEEVKKAATRRGRLASVKLEPVEPVTVLPATLTPVQAEPMDTSAPQVSQLT